jgi:hypothetical protein
VDVDRQPQRGVETGCVRQFDRGEPEWGQSKVHLSDNISLSSQKNLARDSSRYLRICLFELSCLHSSKKSLLHMDKSSTSTMDIDKKQVASSQGRDTTKLDTKRRL